MVKKLLILVTMLSILTSCGNPVKDSISGTGSKNEGEKVIPKIEDTKNNSNSGLIKNDNEEKVAIDEKFLKNENGKKFVENKEIIDNKDIYGKVKKSFSFSGNLLLIQENLISNTGSIVNPKDTKILEKIEGEKILITKANITNDPFLNKYSFKGLNGDIEVSGELKVYDGNFIGIENINGLEYKNYNLLEDILNLNNSYNLNLFKTKKGDYILLSFKESKNEESDVNNMKLKIEYNSKKEEIFQQYQGDEKKLNELMKKLDSEYGIK